MDKLLYEMIYKRRSFHLFTGKNGDPIERNEINDIYSAYKTFTPLYKEIKTAIRIVPEHETTCRRGAEYCILIYSENKNGCLQNAGYLGEQLDLFLVSKGIGTLWFGIGKPDIKEYDGMGFVIMIAIAKIKDDASFRKDMFKSKRKTTDEIWRGDKIDGVTDVVRFAPSACNSQPWLVINDNALSVYRYKKEGKRGIMPKDKVLFYNRIDIGVFLCFLELCLDKKEIAYKKLLSPDIDDDSETVLNAVYSLK